MTSQDQPRSAGQDRNPTWAIVLAGGDGARMASLTEALYGHPVPKQFAAFGDDRTFFQQTLDRIVPIAPPERTIAVVAEAQEALAREQLTDCPDVELVSQPRNLGTALGLHLPLLHVLARDPLARVVVFPSDHHFQRPQKFLEAVGRALDTAETDAASHVTLVGAVAESANTELGWILPGSSIGRTKGDTLSVGGFIEKPDRCLALRLLKEKALWNTMIVAGAAQAVFRLFAHHLPAQTKVFSKYQSHIGTAGAIRVRRAIYKEMTPADFSRDVLEQASGLAVVPMFDAGWSDCGTPERLVAAIRGTPALDRLRDQLTAVRSLHAVVYESSVTGNRQATDE